MTDLRTVLGDIASDAPTVETIRRRLQQPRRRRTPALAAAGVVDVALAAAGTALFTGTRSESPGAAGPMAAAPTLPWTASYFGATDLSIELRADVGMGQKSGAVNIAPQAQDYFDICGAHWVNGIWSTETAIASDGSVPTAPAALQLIGCVLPDGSYGIFRGTAATCGVRDLTVALAPDPSLGVLESPLPTQ